MKKHKRGGKNEKPYRSKPREIDPSVLRKCMRDCQQMQSQREQSRRERMGYAYADAGYDGAEA